jgi:class 3 adenylate cyclase/tetratricopeptide (TPR) repeat protein
MPKINDWLSQLALEKYIDAFSEAEVDFDTLPELTEDDLKELGLPIGPRRKVLGAIRRLGLEGAPADATESVAGEKTGPASVAPQSDAERRHLTVMFVDLVGSTEMASKVDPEEMRDVITNYQNTIAGVVARFEGFVAKFMGDGVLCYFGWPRANEDDAERAVRAGLAMISAVQQMTDPHGQPLAARVGIATGVVIVGDLIGSGATQEAAVVGETPNLAARLQGLAEPNQVVLPKETQILLGDIFEVRPLGGHSLKGISGEVEAFAIIGEMARESRFAARQSGMLTPIVGREQELGLLRDGWMKAKAGDGQFIVITGEAGIGKSRITQAAIDEIAQQDHIRVTFQCSPYHVESAFHPIIQQLTFAAGMNPTDSAEMRLDKLEALDGVDAENAPLLAHLLGIDAGNRYGALALTPAQIRTRTIRCLSTLLIGRAKSTPLLVVFEDLHWVDPTTLELLDFALDAIADEKILILGTARPTFEHGFGGHPLVTRFALNRLGREPIQSIVNKLTAGRVLPDEVLQIISNRTDGVPLFVEELTKTILESGVLKDDGERLVLSGPLDELAIPSTLHDSLMARLDRLQPIKEVAQTAACIGREFEHRLLAKISPSSDDDLNAALEGLIKAELVYRRGLPPDATYLFKHALVRDAAYESLLKERRKSIHTVILTVLENEQDVEAELLAVHAEAADLTDRAIDLWEAASKAAIARPAYDEGISQLGRAITLIQPRLDTGDAAALEQALSLQIQLGMASLARKGYGDDDTIAAFERALLLSENVPESPNRYSILYGLWIGKGIRGEHAEALKRADALVEEAQKASESTPLLVANRVAGAQRWFMGDFVSAQPYLDAALDYFHPDAHAGLADQFGQDVGVSLRIFRALNLLALGKTQAARSSVAEAERLALTTDHTQTICYMYCCVALFALLDGDGATAARLVSTVEPIANEHGLTVWICFAAMLRETLAILEGDEDGVRRFMIADAAMANIKTKLFVPQIRVEAARAAFRLGLQSQAVELAALAQEMIEETGETYTLADLYCLQGALALKDGKREAAEGCLQEAIRTATEQGGKLFELRASIELARLWRDSGRNEDAVDLLNRVCEDIDPDDCVEEKAIAQDLFVARSD